MADRGAAATDRGTPLPHVNTSNIVLKVQFAEDGQVRRIPASRILSSSSARPSYGALRSLVIRLAFPGIAAADDERLFDVKISYADEDEDIITVSTDEELEDAFGQIIEAGRSPPVLRAMAAVKKRGNDDDDDDTEAPKMQPDPEPNAEPKPKTIPKSSQTAPSQVERCLATGRVGNVEWDLLATQAGNLGKEAGEIAEQLAQDLVESVSLLGGTGAVTAAEKEEGEGAEKDPTETATPDGAAQGVKGAKDDSEAKAEDAEAPRFIHGRHTCDGCGVTPIIGTRYHATDRMDYDLCEECFDTGKGVGSRKFLPEELDRDRPFQFHWACRGRMGGGPSLCGGRPLRGGRPHRSCRHQMWRERRQGQKQEEDPDLQEAILRSTQNTAGENEGGRKEAEEADGTAAPPPAPSAPPAEQYSTTSDFATSAASWRDVAESFSSAAIMGGNFSDAIGLTLSTATSEIEKRATKVEAAAEAAARAQTAKAEAGTAEPSAEGSGRAGSIFAKVAGTVASEIKAAVEREQSKRKANKSGGEECGSDVPNMDNAQDTKVGSNNRNAGNGGSAENITAESGLSVPVGGAGLSKEESSQHQEKKPKVGSGEIPAEEDSAELGPPSEIVVKSDVSEGGENEGGDGVGKKVEDEWQVVSEDEETSKTDPTPTQKIVASEPEASTPPTIPPPVLSRWGAHLEQLHELGFLDDHRSVSILESLQAANLGVGSADEVTVTDAVNYLLGFEK